MPTCEIIAVGTEILLGDIINTNAAYISRRLAENGLTVYRQCVVGDNSERLKETIRECFSRSDIIIVTGGLGPTCDDLTKETVADFFGLEMYMDDYALESMKRYFDSTGKTMTDNNIKQAKIPVTSAVFENNWGTAPGLAVEKNGKTAILLPGPPNEMKPMFEKYVIPFLKKYTTSVFYSLYLHFFDIGESFVESELHDIMEHSTDPTVSPYAKDGEVRVRITSASPDSTESMNKCRKMADTIYSTKIGKYILCESDDPSKSDTALAQKIITTLLDNKMTLSFAESCTGGYCSKKITDIPGSSDVFVGSCVTYTNGMKEKMINVSEDTLQKYGAVSEQCAREMAKGISETTGSDIGVSVTGIAGPGGGTASTPVGTVCFGIYMNGTTRSSTEHFFSSSSRSKIRELAAKHALSMILFDL